MSAEVHSESELYRVESRSARKLVWIETIDRVAMRLWRGLPAQRREKRPTGPWLQLDHLRGANVPPRRNFVQQRSARGGVRVQYGKPVTASRIPPKGNL